MQMQPHTASRAAVGSTTPAFEPSPRLNLQIDQERGELDALREAIRRQIEAELDRVERWTRILDTLDGDADLEADYATRQPGGFVLGRSTDDEPDADREGGTDDNGIADGAGAWEQHGSLYGLHGFEVTA